jgi:hypothetical protein
MPSGLKFGVYQLIIYGYLEPAPFGRDESNTFNSQFVVVEKLVCQAHGPVGIVSNNAICYGYF